MGGVAGWGDVCVSTSGGIPLMSVVGTCCEPQQCSLSPHRMKQARLSCCPQPSLSTQPAATDCCDQRQHDSTSRR